MLFFANFPHKQFIDKLMLAFWLAYCMLNVISHNISLYIGGIGNVILVYLFWLYFVLFYGSPRADRARIPIWPILIFTIIFIVVMQFLYNSTSTYTVMGFAFDSRVWNMITFFPMIMSSVVVIQKTNNELIDWLKNCFVIFGFITLVVSISHLIYDFSLAKYTATGKSEYIPFFFGFATIYAFAVIVPITMANVELSAKKIIALIFAACVIYGVLSSSFLIACFVLILEIILYYSFKVNNKYLRGFLILIVVLLTLYFFFSNRWERVLLWVADNIPMEQISIRLTQLVQLSTDNVMGDTTARIKLYEDSMKEIARHPITGNAMWGKDFVISGHSSLLDVWNSCGLFTLAMFVYFYYLVYKYNLTNYCKDHTTRTAWQTSSIGLLIVAIFNPIFASYNIVVFWVLAPMMFFGKKIAEGEED